MTLPENATKLANLINPQVMGDMVSKKLVDLIKFSPLARIDYTLSGRPGTTLTLPYYKYIGDATEVAEGEDIPIGQLSEDKRDVTIKSIGRGVMVTDAAVLSGYGDPLSESVDQLGISIASKIDNEFRDILEGIKPDMTKACAGSTLTADEVADALVLFGEDIDGAKVLLVSPEDYAALRKADDWVPASEIAASMVISGTVGMVHGCEVVVTNKLKGKKEAFVVKPGALALYIKRGVETEADRDILKKCTVITADAWIAAYLYNESKAIKLTTV